MLEFSLVLIFLIFLEEIQQHPYFLEFMNLLIRKKSKAYFTHGVKLAYEIIIQSSSIMLSKIIFPKWSTFNPVIKS